MTYRNALKLGFCFAGAALGGCGPKPDTTKPTTVVVEKDNAHSHGKGPHGGAMFDLGKFHGEFTVDHVKKECTVYVLTGDEKNPLPVAVAAKELTLATKTTKGEDGKAVPPLSITLKPVDAKDGKASKFVGTDPGLGNVADFAGTVSGEIDGKPSKGDFKEEEHGEAHSRGPADNPEQGVAQTDTKGSEVYLKPGGIYTEADIAANGNTTVARKFKSLKVSHDLKPKVGDKICPITLTKSNPELKWVIGGKMYEFCCQPCVEEFVLLAKSKPDEIMAPETYIKH